MVTKMEMGFSKGFFQARIRRREIGRISEGPFPLLSLHKHSCFQSNLCFHSIWQDNINITYGEEDHHLQLKSKIFTRTAADDLFSDQKETNTFTCSKQKPDVETFKKCNQMSRHRSCSYWYYHKLKKYFLSITS